jgi:hypothetical protein
MTLFISAAINRNMDKMARLEIHVLQKSWPAYKVCGYIGLVCAIVLALSLTTHLGLSHLTTAGLILSSLSTFLLVAIVTTIIFSEERLVYYHHQIAIIAVSTFLLVLLRQPILPYLDITILGIGAFLVCGRVGCLMVGCCHGRPSPWGICYRKEHVDAGFTPYYEGVRLFPVQAVESIGVLVIVIVGVVFVLIPQPAGRALAWYVIAYGVGRVTIEFARGDPDRPYLYGLSEAQWTSVTLMSAVVWGEVAGILPFRLWHIIATMGLVLTLIAVALFRHLLGTGKHQILNPRHVRELAEAIDMISGTVSERTVVAVHHTVPEVIPMNSTSLGIQLSGGKIKDANTSIDHYAISSQKGIMSEEGARSVADLIIHVKHLSGVNRLITGGNGVFHVLIHPHKAGDQG